MLLACHEMLVEAGFISVINSLYESTAVKNLCNFHGQQPVKAADPGWAVSEYSAFARDSNLRK